MKQLQPDLWQSTRYSSGMLNSYAYLLLRPAGNVLFYNSGNESDLRQMDALGGAQLQLLTHRDEATPSLARIKDRFGLTLASSALEAPYLEKYTPVDLVLEPGTTQLQDIHVIETPGHTDGSLCFFYESPHGKSYLFTGDTIFLWDGDWSTFVMPKAGGSASALVGSLKELGRIQPDLVMSSGFVGDVGLLDLTPAEWNQAIEHNIQKLERLT
ncbi:MBL fold metallo-hydrolase [Pseudoteredinibacter isoporae]|uniref:Glyoxylase-like metal-dependent hydrolase (Beta-lactamase superfamily II) n=1 Tax=Pseudoteredinibacter isoporae TaxID=570281 RepID=A0A7X0MXY9_9GAMM|nr:MBL fold metallo-hydrolase [Pseudoteredinibacter isoporae]MBB6522499.1 glyoxylase-like metal-dependent hydrolase (beta-lactamase superfamily II) [Pseudoteredinibacter isoporae]NHO88028.1 MBL fold metallo-hydrolase [Pseudoteredinibacter isoporae]NIB23641.1 MBL fold metallo-hydrolase [Pseudoteredinibacter isoporae]